MYHDQLTQSSVLASLRGVIPQRATNFTEALRVAELQASRLLELWNVHEAHVPNEVVSELPRVRIVYENLPVSGTSHWNGTPGSSPSTRKSPARVSGLPCCTSSSTSLTTATGSGSTPATAATPPASRLSWPLTSLRAARCSPSGCSSAPGATASNGQPTWRDNSKSPSRPSTSGFTKPGSALNATAAPDRLPVQAATPNSSARFL